MDHSVQAAGPTCRRCSINASASTVASHTQTGGKHSQQQPTDHNSDSASQQSSSSPSLQLLTACCRKATHPTSGSRRGVFTQPATNHRDCISVDTAPGGGQRPKRQRQRTHSPHSHSHSFTQRAADWQLFNPCPAHYVEGACRVNRLSCPHHQQAMKCTRPVVSPANRVSPPGQGHRPTSAAAAPRV